MIFEQIRQRGVYAVGMMWVVIASVGCASAANEVDEERDENAVLGFGSKSRDSVAQNVFLSSSEFGALQRHLNLAYGCETSSLAASDVEVAAIPERVSDAQGIARGGLQLAVKGRCTYGDVFTISAVAHPVDLSKSTWSDWVSGDLSLAPLIANIAHTTASNGQLSVGEIEYIGSENGKIVNRVGPTTNVVLAGLQTLKNVKEKTNSDCSFISGDEFLWQWMSSPLTWGALLVLAALAILAPEIVSLSLVVVILVSGPVAAFVYTLLSSMTEMIGAALTCGRKDNLSRG